MRKIGKMGSKKGKIKTNEEINMRMRINEEARVRRKGIIISLFPISFPLLTILAITLFLTLLFFIPLSFSPPRYYCWYYQYYSGPDLCSWWRDSLTQSGSASYGSGGNVWTDDNNVLGRGKGRSYCLYEQLGSESYADMCGRVGQVTRSFLQNLGILPSPFYGFPSGATAYFSSGECRYYYYNSEKTVSATCGDLGGSYGHAAVYNGKVYTTMCGLCEGIGSECDTVLLVTFCKAHPFNSDDLQDLCNAVSGCVYYSNACIVGNSIAYSSDSAICSAAGADLDGRKCKWKTTGVIPGNKLCSYYYNKNGVYGTDADPNYDNTHIDKTRDESYDASSGTCYFDRVKYISIEQLCKQATNDDPNAYRKVESGGKILYEICRVKKKAW